jgi:hypothetical protein
MPGKKLLFMLVYYFNDRIALVHTYAYTLKRLLCAAVRADKRDIVCP